MGSQVSASMSNFEPLVFKEFSAIRGQTPHICLATVEGEVNKGAKGFEPLQSMGDLVRAL
jgi:hypothetical protein